MLQAPERCCSSHCHLLLLLLLLWMPCLQCVYCFCYPGIVVRRCVCMYVVWWSVEVLFCEEEAE